VNKAMVLETLNIEGMKRDSEEILDKLAGALKKRAAIRTDLRDAESILDSAKAELMLTEQYVQGKNAEVRNAWLVTQHSYQKCLHDRDELQRRLDEVDAEITGLSNRFSNLKVDKKMAAALLEFLSE
jgi:chromosome segregation ATPase